jgi:hypothetical protein
MAKSVVPPPISIKATPPLFSLDLKLHPKKNGSNVNPDNSIPEL